MISCAELYLRSEERAINNLLYQALVPAVWRAHPGMVVEHLPALYTGALRRPALVGSRTPDSGAALVRFSAPVRRYRSW